MAPWEGYKSKWLLSVLTCTAGQQAMAPWSWPSAGIVRRPGCRGEVVQSLCLYPQLLGSVQFGFQNSSPANGTRLMSHANQDGFQLLLTIMNLSEQGEDKGTQSPHLLRMALQRIPFPTPSICRNLVPGLQLSSCLLGIVMSAMECLDIADRCTIQTNP